MIEGARLKDMVNADPEFRLAARHWTGTVGLAMGSQTLLLSFEDGEMADARPGAVAAADVRLAAAEADWAEFFKPVPKPFYQGMLPAIARQGFTLEGDIESWTAYYGALGRVLALIRLSLGR